MIHTVCLNHITSLTKADVTQSYFKEDGFLCLYAFQQCSLFPCIQPHLCFICKTVALISLYLCVCLFVSVYAAVASEKPILQACQIQSQCFWRKRTSLLPPEWICCNTYFIVCLIIFEEHQMSLYLHSKFTRQLCKGNQMWFVQYLT